MQHYFNQKDIQINTEKGSVVALGKFDGFHQGHKLLLDEVLRLQKDDQLTLLFKDYEYLCLFIPSSHPT